MAALLNITERTKVKFQASGSTKSRISSSFDTPISGTSLSPQQRYSPSGSFIQIQPLDRTLTCGSVAAFHIQYASNITLETLLHYQVCIH